jgi:hypothetical protein
MEWVLTGTVLQPVSNPSSRVAQLLQDPTAKGRQSAGIASVHPTTFQNSGIDEPIDFHSVRNEVNAFGAKHLTKKRDKQTYEKQTLELLGLSSSKVPRTSAF